MQTADTKFLEFLSFYKWLIREFYMEQEVGELRGSQDRAKIGESFFAALEKLDKIHAESKVR